MGIVTIDKRSFDAIGSIAEAWVVQEKDDISLISSQGIVIRLSVEEISVQGRATRGVRVMHLGDGDTVAALARIPEQLITE